MSRLLKKLRAVRIGEGPNVLKRMSALDRVFKADFVFDKSASPYMGTDRYRVEIKLGCEALVSAIDDPDVINAAVREVERQLIEAIYGEFREDFRAIAYARLQGDDLAVAGLLKSMEDKMFSGDYNDADND